MAGHWVRGLVLGVVVLAGVLAQPAPDSAQARPAQCEWTGRESYDCPEDAILDDINGRHGDAGSEAEDPYQAVYKCTYPATDVVGGVQGDDTDGDADRICAARRTSGNTYYLGSPGHYSHVTTFGTSNQHELYLTGNSMRLGQSGSGEIWVRAKYGTFKAYSEVGSGSRGTLISNGAAIVGSAWCRGLLRDLTLARCRYSWAKRPSAAAQSTSTPSFGISTLETGSPPADAESRLAHIADHISNFDGTRSVGSFNATDFYLAPGTENRVCLAAVASTTRAICADPGSRYDGRTGLISQTIMDEAGRQTSAILVPDGYDRARVVSGRAETLTEVSRNVVFVAHQNPVVVELTGAGATPLQSDLRGIGR